VEPSRARHMGRSIPANKPIDARPVVASLGSAPQRLVPAAARPRVEGWLGENIALHGSCRVVGVSRRWLMDLVSAGFLALPEHLDIPPARSPPAVRIQRLDGEADERCSLVEKKAHQPWRWLAMATPTRQVMAFPGGDRRRQSAEPLGATLPAGYRERATCDTAQYEADDGGIPAAPPKALTKKARKPNHIARFNNRLGHRGARRVRDPLAFSKTLETPIGASRDFMCHDTLTRAAA
jgi:IS1 family transposase